MEQRRLATSGLAVSEIGLGCNNFGWRIGADEARRVVARALDLGITLFDTADMYGNRGASEEMLGAALGARRHEAVLATKFGMAMGEGPEWRGASRRYIQVAVEASLRRLKTDWIDLYQLHVPDAETPIEETMRALDELVRAGKVRYIGVCNLNSAQLAEARDIALSAGLAPIVSLQVEYSLLSRSAERDIFPVLGEMGLLPYFPLAGGLLTGKYRDPTSGSAGRLSTGSAMAGQFLTDRNRAISERLAALAESDGGSLLQLAFAWLLARREVASVIAGATSADQVEQNVSAARWRPSAGLLIEASRIAADEVGISRE